MDLKGQVVLVHLSDEGRRVLRQAGWDAEDAPPTSFEVQEETDGGLWVQLTAAGRQYAVLIRWNFILAVVVDIGEVKTEGLVH